MGDLAQSPLRFKLKPFWLFEVEFQVNVCRFKPQYVDITINSNHFGPPSFQCPRGILNVQGKGLKSPLSNSGTRQNIITRKYIEMFIDLELEIT